MRWQATPVAGISSELEVAMEWEYNQHMLDTAAQQKKKELQEKSVPKPALSSRPAGLKTLGCGDMIKLHLCKKAPGEDWTHVPSKDNGPDVGRRYETPHRGAEADQASRSPLTEELLAPRENITTVLDKLEEDPEIVQAVANIPLRADLADVEMAEEPLGFEPEVGWTGYDINLVRHSEDAPLGSTSPVTAQENQLLDAGTANLTCTPGMGRPGTEENTGRPITRKD